MVFAIPPQEIINMTGLSVPKMVLGGKDNDPSMWRILTDMNAGRTLRPQQKTLRRLETLLISSLNRLTGESPPCGFLSKKANVSGDRPWEFCVAALNEGRIQADPNFDPSLDLFGIEAIRFDQIACHTNKAFLDQGNYQAAVEHIKSQWTLSHLPSSQWVIENIDTSDSRDRFIVTALPLTIITTLYLLACWSVGFEISSNAISVMPERRGERLVRPMTRWLEGIKVRDEIQSVRSLSDYFLYPRTESEDIDTLRRLFRRWWTKGEIPPWSRVPHIANSISRVIVQAESKEISEELHWALTTIRVVDRLLSLSLEIKEHCLPDYDPLLPFQDYELMLEHARKAKAALQLHVKQ